MSEPGYDTLRGTEALMEYAIRNPHNWRPKQVNDFAACLWQGVCAPVREMDCELPNTAQEVWYCGDNPKKRRDGSSQSRDFSRLVQR